MADVIPMVGAPIAVALIVALHVTSRRAVPLGHADRWRQEVAEPWGSIALATVVCSPAAVIAWWATGSVVAGGFVLGLVSIGLCWRTAAISGIREVVITDSAVWVRSLRGLRTIPLAHVVGVRRGSRGCEMVLASGRRVRLPEGDGGRRLAATIEQRARRWQRPFLVATEVRSGRDPRPPRR